MTDPSPSSIDFETHQKQIEALTKKHQEQLAELRQKCESECVQVCRSFTDLHKAADEEKDELTRQRETELLDGFVRDIDYLQKANEKKQKGICFGRLLERIIKIEERLSGSSSDSAVEFKVSEVVVQLLRKFVKEIEQLREAQAERRESLVCQKHVLAEKSKNAKLQRQVEILQLAVAAANFIPGEVEGLREQVKKLENKLADETQKTDSYREMLGNLEKASDGAISFFKARHYEQKKEIKSQLESVEFLESELARKQEGELLLRNVCAKLEYKLDLSKSNRKEESDQLKKAVKKRDDRVKKLEKKLRVAKSVISELRRRKEQLEHELDMVELVDLEEVRRMLAEICDRENSSKSIRSSKRRRLSRRKSHLQCVRVIERILIQHAKNGDFQRAPKHDEELLEKVYKKIAEVARNTDHLARPSCPTDESSDSEDELKPSTTP